MIAMRAVLSSGVGVALMLCVGPASAQFGGLFDPPRPPSLTAPNQRDRRDRVVIEEGDAA